VIDVVPVQRKHAQCRAKPILLHLWKHWKMDVMVSSKQTIRDIVEYHPEGIGGGVGGETRRAHLYHR
jgi:hypothetical protein